MKLWTGFVRLYSGFYLDIFLLLHFSQILKKKIDIYYFWEYCIRVV